MDFIPNNVYKRTDIHNAIGGQRQGGISTPKKENVILIFSGDSGHSYGYQDRWTEDGLFLYTGEGQIGDMKFIRGNSAIRDHELNGKRLLLFMNDRRAHVRYHGEVRYVDFENFLTPDREGNTRKAIRFIFENVDGDSEALTPESSMPNRHKKPNTTERKGLITSRVGQGYYRQAIIEKYNGKCAVTGSDLTEILIASHIVPWRMSTDQERLDVENGILLSPNYDALFDKHLVSFDDTGKIIISDSLTEEDINHLGINQNSFIEVTEEMKAYLARHRENLR